MSEIKLDMQSLAEDIARFQTAMDSFQSYDSDFIKQLEDQLNGNSSNFLDEMLKTMNSMRDDKAKKLTQELENYQSDITGLYNSFLSVDNGIANQIAGGGR